MSSSSSPLAAAPSPSREDPLLLSPSAQTALGAEASAAAADAFIKEHEQGENILNTSRDWHVIESHHREDGDDPLNISRVESNDDEDDSPSTSSPSSTSSQTAIWLGATANLCSATLGCGVLALPAACAQTGVVVAVVLTVVAALATIYSIRLLVEACATYSLYSYESLTQYCLGKGWRTAVEINMLLFCQGTAVAYLIAVADILEQAHLLVNGSRALTLTIVWTLVELPLSLGRKMTHLQMASALGIASISTLVFAAFVHLLDDQAAEKQHNSDDSDSDNRSSWTAHDLVWPSQGIINALTACPIILFAFSCQVNVCAIFHELPSITSRSASSSRHAVVDDDNDDDANEEGRNQNHTSTTPEEVVQKDEKQRLMSCVTLSAVMLCTLLYTSISTVILADFGPKVAAQAPNLLQLYHLHASTGGSASLMQVAAACMAVAVLVAFPLNIFPARVTLTGIFCSTTASNTSRRHQRSTSIASSIGNENLTAALLEDYHDEHLEEEGTTTTTRTRQQQHEDKEKTSVTTAAGTTTTTATASQETEDGAHVERRQNVSNDEIATTTTTEENSKLSLANHVALTLLLAGSALGLALIVPDISVIFSILGGTASSFLGFCIPGMLGLKMHRDARQQDDQQPQRRGLSLEERCLPLLSWALVVFGVVMGILTTVATIYSLVVPQKESG